MIEFSAAKIERIKGEIDRCLDAGATPIAAFDADGTLWSCDMGEGLFRYQIEQRLLKNLRSDAWDHYQKWHKESPRDAFLWLAQINEGVPLETVREWARGCVKSLAPLPVFTAVGQIIDHLHKRGVVTYVVTASIKWAVEPAAGLFDIPYERVIGITTKVKDGVVTAEQDGPITWRQGKVEGLRLATHGRPAFFAAGNTKGDLPLLESATHVRLVLASAGPGHVNFETEQEMLRLAAERGWFSHAYV